MIEDKHIISVIRSIPTDGHQPYLVLGNDMKQYIIKPPNSTLDIISLQKEFLCSLFLKLWNIKTPDIYSCTLSEELKLIDKRFRFTDQIFGSRSIDPQVELNQLFQFEGKIALRKIRNKEDLIRIALFDIWIENDDRRATNSNILMKMEEGSFEYYAIDHAFTFASLSFKELNNDYVSFSDNDSILYSDMGKSVVRSLEINEVWLANLKEYFYLCTTKVREQLDDIQLFLPSSFSLKEEEIERLKGFLFDSSRLDKVYTTLCYILSDIRR